MKITIDEKQCGKHLLTPEEVFIALAVRQTREFQKTIDNMVSREILTVVDGKYMVTQHWSDEIDEIIADSSGAIDNEERLLNLAKQMRELYPRGKMPDTPYLYRCNNREVVLKLKKFFTLYGNYKDEDILDATRRFVASFQGNYRYLPLIKYFIHKDKLKLGEDGQQHVVPESQLASYLENKEDTSNLVTASDDWLTNVRN